HTYATLLRRGWVRKGTNTYMDPRRIKPAVLDMIAGNECIGTADYEAFLLGAGAQAISSLPGVRIENTVDVKEWSAQVERGELAVCLPKCSLAHQKDIALWAFPLRFEGLSRLRYDRMVANDALSPEQTHAFQEAVAEGLVVPNSTGFELSILGEVF